MMKPLLRNLALMIVLAANTCLTAQEFRIETDIYVDEKGKPVSENLTLFTEQAVYDFQLAKTGETPIEVVIYRFKDKSFVLLDPSRKVKYELDQVKLKHFVQSLREDTQFRQKMAFLFDPEFEKDENEKGWLALNSKQLQYKCRGETISDELAAKRYFEFIDQYALLNVTDPRKMPPFARLKLNEEIAHKNWMPDTVSLELQPPGETGKKLRVKSKHFVIWKLSKSDRQRMESAEKMLEEFETVDITRYRQLNETRTASRKTTTSKN